MVEKQASEYKTHLMRKFNLIFYKVEVFVIRNIYNVCQFNLYPSKRFIRYCFNCFFFSRDVKENIITVYVCDGSGIIYFLSLNIDAGFQETNNNNKKSKKTSEILFWKFSREIQRM